MLLKQLILIVIAIFLVKAHSRIEVPWPQHLMLLASTYLLLSGICTTQRRILEFGEFTSVGCQQKPVSAQAGDSNFLGVSEFRASSFTAREFH